MFYVNLYITPKILTLIIIKLSKPQLERIRLSPYKGLNPEQFGLVIFRILVSDLQFMIKVLTSQPELIENNSRR